MLHERQAVASQETSSFLSMVNPERSAFSHARPPMEFGIYSSPLALLMLSRRLFPLLFVNPHL